MAGPKKILNWMSIDVDPDVITRYQKKNKVPPAKKPVEFETRYHRTHSKNAPSIDKQGLLTFNPNIGKNTYLSNAADYHNIWLADNATNIPVLRGLLEDSPQDVTTYKVRMPKQWYLESPRFYMPGGRGAGKLKPQPKDKPQLTNEGSYKIDLVGNDIPPRYLQKLPVFNQSRSYITDKLDEYMFDAAFGLIDKSSLPKSLRGEISNLVNANLHSPHGYEWKRITPSEELLRVVFPMDYKYDIYRDFLQTADKMNRDFANLPTDKVSPREKLDRILSRTSYSLFPETGVLGSNATAKLKPADGSQLARGSISRAIEDLPVFKTAKKLRQPGRIDWDIFNRYYNAGHSPKRALMEGYIPSHYVSWISDEPRAKQLRSPSFGEGAITRGMQAEEPIQHRLGNAAQLTYNDNKSLLPLAKLVNYGTERLPSQINNPKMQAILDKYADRVPFSYLKDVFYRPGVTIPFTEGPYKDYLWTKYQDRKNKWYALRKKQTSMAQAMAKSPALRESDVHKLFNITTQWNELDEPGISASASVPEVRKLFRNYGVFDKLPRKDINKVNAMLEDLAKQYNKRSK